MSRARALGPLSDDLIAGTRFFGDEGDPFAAKATRTSTIDPQRFPPDIGPPTALSRPQRPDPPPITLIMLWAPDSTLISRALAKERLDLVLKGAFVHHACVRLGNLPAAVNEQSHRERGESTVSGG